MNGKNCGVSIPLAGQQSFAKSFTGALRGPRWGVIHFFFVMHSGTVFYCGGGMMYCS